MRRSFLRRHRTWRGIYIDLWTLPHVISGAIIAHLALLAHMNYSTAFWMTLAIGVGWELMERLTGLSRTEAYRNSLADIVGAQIGFVIGWWLFTHLTNPIFEPILVLVLFGLFCLICFFGYRAFKYYG